MILQKSKTSDKISRSGLCYMKLKKKKKVSQLSRKNPSDLMTCSRATFEGEVSNKHRVS